MAIKINSMSFIFEDLKKKLEQKNTLILDIKAYLMFHRYDEQLSDFLLENLTTKDEILKRNSLIGLYIILIDFDEKNKIKDQDKIILNNLIDKYNIKISLVEIEDELNKIAHE